MLKYFLPDWEDRLDPRFDFVNDEYCQGHKDNPYKHDVYAHQLFKQPPYDGILFSLSVFQSKISLTNAANDTYRIRDTSNIKTYLKIPLNSTIEVMGDCGAFGYVNENSPPLPFYSVKNVANLYEKLGFDYGVSVDHLVVKYVLERNPETGKKERRYLTLREKKKRVKITLDNAHEFLRYHKKQGFKFKPMGVAQGYDVRTYRDSVSSLIRMGYDYIGIGSLVQYQSSFVIQVLKGIQPLIKDRSVHLFGILRPEFVKEFEALGVTSLDSASFLRKAWLRSGQNYLGSNGDWYTAIRVPQSDNAGLVRNAAINGYSTRDLVKLERRALKALGDYDAGKIGIRKALNSVMKYDELLIRSADENAMRKKYERTLREKPWESCSCEMCKELGIHIVIFRGCNRNKRRGFHNTWLFHQGIRNSEVDGKVAEEEKIEVSNSEIDEEIENMTKTAAENKDELQKFLNMPQSKESIKQLLITRKTIQRLVEIAKGSGME